MGIAIQEGDVGSVNARVMDFFPEYEFLEDYAKKFEKFSSIVSNPKYACTKCGRVADKKKWLHKPIELT